jgi:hypothetical protein
MTPYDDPEDLTEANERATARLLELLQKHHKLIRVSTRKSRN